MPKKAKEEIVKEKKINSKTATKTTKSTSKLSNKTQKSTSTKSSKKVASKSNNRKTTRKKTLTPEYYDLPNLYNQTIVKILAQTPTILFVYWDISDEDKQFYLKQYGESFFNSTIPYLYVTNETKGYSFDVEINDYANSWYINIPDSDCKYDVVLLRKPKDNKIYQENIYITSSNNLQTPNDHILFDSLGKTVFFKNVKTNDLDARDTSSLSFINNIGRIYNVYDLYKEIYKDELRENKLDVYLTSSKMSS